MDITDSVLSLVDIKLTTVSDSRHPETVSLVLDIVSDVTRGEGERREGVGVLAQLSSSNNNLSITSSLLSGKLDTLFPAMQRESH